MTPQAREPDDRIEEANEHEDNGDPYIGDIVVDSDDEDPDPAIVVNCPEASADEWEVIGDTTVADDNPEYPQDAEVVVVAFESDLRELYPAYIGKSPLPLSTIQVKYYAFPAPRLDVVGELPRDQREVSVDELNPSPLHVREFDAEKNADYIEDVAADGEHGSLLIARETDGGLELVEGHKRKWVAEEAGLETVEVAVADMTPGEAAAHYLKDHLEHLSDAEREEVLDRAVNSLETVDDPKPLRDYLEERGVIKPRLPEVLEPVEERLSESAEVERAERDGNMVLVVEKLGQEYIVRDDGTVEGDGALQDRVEKAVEEVLE